MSDELQARFAKAAEEVKGLPRRPDNETLLALYAHYKQGTAGDVQGKRPGMLAMVERAKYDAWDRLKGTPPASAMQAYIDLVERLKQAR